MSFYRKRYAVLFGIILTITAAVITWRFWPSFSVSEQTIRTQPQRHAVSQSAATTPQLHDDTVANPADDVLGDVRKAVIEKAEQDLVIASMPLRMRIQKDIDCLRQESTDQSLLMLSEVEMFYWPGTPSNGGAVKMPLIVEEEDQTLNRVLSNRRVLKLYDELSKMPKEKASKLIAERIEKSLVSYKDAYGKYYDGMVIKQAAGGTAPVAGMSVQVSNNADHSPTLAGLRLQLLALILIAGNLQLDSTAPAIDSVVKQAVSERDQLYNDTRINIAARFSTLKNVSLYNRRILCTGIMGTNQNETTDDQWSEYRLTKYNAAATQYDMLTRGNGPIPIDYSKGYIQLRIYMVAKDADVGAILKP